MKHLVAGLLLAVAAAPAAGQTAAPGPSETEATKPRADADKPEEKKKAAAGEKNAADGGEEFDIAKMMQLFDKLFPAQPAPPPERLALARTTAAGVLPNGTYAAMFEELMSGLVDKVLSMSPADFGEGKDSDKASTTSLREEIAKGDPHFEERMRITRRVIGEELLKVSAVMEPKIREGLASSIARRFDERQLHEINAFLATDSGRAFAGQTMRMWMDPDVMRSMFQTLPDIVAAVPGAMMRLEAETAHLPKPKKDESKSKEKEADAQEPDSEE